MVAEVRERQEARVDPTADDVSDRPPGEYETRLVEHRDDEE